MRDKSADAGNLKTSFASALSAAGGAAAPFATYATATFSGLPQDVSLMTGLTTGALMGGMSPFVPDKARLAFSSGYTGFFTLLAGVTNAETLQYPSVYKPDAIIWADALVMGLTSGGTLLTSCLAGTNAKPGHTEVATGSALTSGLVATALATALMMGNGNKPPDTPPADKPAASQTLSLAHWIPR